MVPEIESLYEVLKEKYKLPSYAKLNWEYEIGNIEEDDLLIRNIRKKITEKIEYMINILSSIIQPETDAANLHEASFFDDKEKEDILSMYKLLMYYYRYSSKLNVHDSEKENADFILEADDELKKMKPNLLKYFDKIKESWTKEMKTKDAAGYFG